LIKLTAAPLNLTLRHTFSTSRSSSTIARNVLLHIRSGALEGIGEASPIRFYGQTQESCIAALNKMGRVIAGHDVFEIENTIQELRRKFPSEPSAIAAVDLALHDLIGKRLKIPLWKYFGLDPSKTPRTSFTIGIDTLEKVLVKIREAERYPILKIKVGGANDMEIMRQVRKLVPKKLLRVDANCGWSVKESIAKARILEKMGVEFIEQPVPPGNNAALKRIKNRIGIPLMTDESSLVPQDIPALRGCVDGINIKLVKCGGLREGLKMIHTARACGLKIMLGCMIESSVLISAAAQLAPLVDYADLDGNLLIRDDPFTGVRIDKDAKLVLPNRAGLGLKAR
jgi:L-alanine-DL-glutamate epimerase-like enolase superfamily enzyme